MNEERIQVQRTRCCRKVHKEGNSVSKKMKQESVRRRTGHTTCLAGARTESSKPGGGAKSGLIILGLGLTAGCTEGAKMKQGSKTWASENHRTDLNQGELLASKRRTQAKLRPAVGLLKTGKWGSLERWCHARRDNRALEQELDSTPRQSQPGSVLKNCSEQMKP
jgi:hypothetical protein